MGTDCPHMRQCLDKHSSDTSFIGLLNAEVTFASALNGITLRSTMSNLHFCICCLYLNVLLGSLNVGESAGFQSEPCTDHELATGTQCFRRIPDAAYSLPRGYTVLLHCIVENMRGKAQWRFSNLLLGHDRNIPGFERVSMPGDPNTGDVSLQIRNLTIGDTGEYECQVTPSMNQPLLRRKTWLQVTVMPSVPRLFALGKEVKDRSLVVPLPDEEKTITVECVASHGIPPPDFYWKLNDVLLRSMPRDDKSTVRWPQIVTNQGEDRSIVTLLKSDLKTGDNLTCEVSNNATLIREDVTARTLRTTTLIDVHVPPGPPKITLISNHYDETFDEGTQLKAECVAMPPGHPVGALFWRWHFPPSMQATQPPLPRISLGLPFYSQDFVQTISNTEDVPTSFYETFTNGELKAVLTIPNINRRYHCAKLSCETAHDTGVSRRVDVKVKIRFPPHNLTIKLKNKPLLASLVNGRPEMVAYAQENTKLKFICTTDEMYPDVTLKWVLLTEDRAPVQSEIVVNRDLPKASTRHPGAFIRESEVTIKMMQRNQHGFLDCQAWYGGTNRVVRSVRLGIIYPPDEPTIKGLGSAEPIRTGESRILVCECLNGYPPPELQWFKNGEPIETTFTQQHFRGGVRLDLKIVARMEDNGAKIKCRAKSRAQVKEVESRPLVLNVHFPPSEVIVSIAHQGDILADQEMEVSCEARSANPPARLQWRYYHCSRIKQYMRRADHSTILLTSLNQVAKPSVEVSSTQNEAPQDCEMDERIGIEDPTTEGSHGGFISRGRLLLRPEWRDHLDIVACLASNSVYNHLTKQNQVQLNVSFRPHFIGFQPGDSHSIVEGSSGTLDLIPYGNPRCTNIAWLVKEQILKKSPIDPRTADFSKRSIKRTLSKLTGLYQLDELLVIWNIKRNQTTNVTIRAENSLGTTKATFLLDVTYPAKVTGVVDANVSLGEMAVLVCMARGNPTSATNAFSWHRLLFPKWDKEANEAPAIETTSLGCSDVTRINGAIKHMVQCEDVDRFNMRSHLLVYNVTGDDVGLYGCTVDNGISTPDQSQVKLLSSFAPEIVRQPKFAKVAASFETSAVLQCFVRVEPIPRVIWLLNQRNQEGSTTVTRVLDSQCGAFVAGLGVPCVQPASPKFFQSLTQIRPGYYAAKLHINAIDVSDFGQYTCKVMAASGDEDQFTIQVTGTGPPEVPYDLRLLNASTTGLQVAWGQGFNGGYKQTFTVRWKSDLLDDQYRYADVAEIEDKGDVVFIINGLKPNTQYEIGVSSRNDIHGQTEYTKSIFGKTSPVLEEFDEFDDYHSIKTVGYTKSNSLFIIVAACVIGGVVIFVNVVVITYLIRKRYSRGNQTAILSAPKSHILPMEKRCRGGPKYDGHYCRDPQHRHFSGEHFYVPDPLLIGETAQTNPAYGCAPPGDHLSEIGNTICQSAYMPETPPTLYTSEATYPHIHHTLAGAGSHTSPLPVQTLNSHTMSSTPKVVKIASGQGHRSGSKFFVRPRYRLRRRQSFGDALDRALVANGRATDQVCCYRSTLERLPVRGYCPVSSYAFNPLDDQQCGVASSRANEHHDSLGYTENCYIDQLEALQKGDSPTKRLLLNGGPMSESVTQRGRSTTSNTECCGVPDVVV
ncbi:Nephrin [Taenia crassiceps]|uniref:Nephrin n=1 Tax=Taenia crassiceps TaxID=6207 RepID=A0ABR4QS27_9CEST